MITALALITSFAFGLLAGRTRARRRSDRMLSVLHAFGRHLHEVRS